MSSHEQDTPAADTYNRTQVQQLPEGTSSDDVNSTSPNFGTFTGPSVPGYPFLSQPQASGEIGRLGEYRVLAKLGEGGMGFVFRAEDPALKRFVALKVMRPEVAAKPLAADRFLREGRAAAGLKSDHIITIYQVGQANGAPFIAMEYLEGIALDEWMKQQKKAVPVPHVLRVVRDTLRGLATAHDKGLIHRDIKPANLWIEKGTARIKVLDFGLTRGMDGNDQMTADGAVVGTPAYMAPEQAAGKPVDPRADLFSVGTVMYQLFLGINPFVRSNMMATMGAVSFDVQPPVVALRPEVPQAYSDYLDRLLAKDPAGRPANAKAALAELAAIEKTLQDTAKTLASSSSLPVVSMMAPAAAPAAAHVWGSITDSEDAVVRTKISDPETPRKPPSKKLLIGSGLFAFFALILGGIVIIITNKDGTKTKVEVADGATVDVQKDGKSVASVGGKKAEVAKTNVVMDADRKAAQIVIGSGGTIGIEGNERIADAKDLPKEPFKILGIDYIHGNDPKISDADLDLFRSLDSVTTFNTKGTITDAGFAKLATFPWVNRLTTLGLSSEELTDAAFPSAAKFTSLHSLALQSKRITGSGIVHLKASSIAWLGIDKCGLVDAEMVHLKAMPKLCVLTIISTTIGDAGLKHISEVKQLGTLQMQNCGNLTDEGMKHLEKCLTLQRLEFGNNSNKMTGATLKSVGKLKNLTSLGLPNPYPDAPSFLTDADLKPLVGCEKLETIRGINHKNITDLGLETLAQLKNLKELQVQGTKVTAEGVKKLRTARPECKIESDFDVDADRKAAEFVFSHGGPYVDLVTQGRIDDVKKLPAEKFQVSRIQLATTNVSPISDADLDVFRGLEALNYCALRGTITDAGVAKIAESPNAAKLRELRIFSEGLTDAAYQHIPKFRELEGLCLSSSKITGKGLVHLKGIPIQSIELGGCAIADQEWAHLKELPKLTSLVMEVVPLSNAALTHIGKLTKLQELSFYANSTMKDEDLKHLEGLNELRWLHLDTTTLTGKGFSSLAKLPKLEKVYAPESQLTDEGLKALIECKSLKIVDARRTKATAEGVKAFRKARPDVTVTSDFDIDPDRKAAEFVIGKGGVVVVHNPEKNVITKRVEDLPKEPFKLNSIEFLTDATGTISDADLDQFRELDFLVLLDLRCPNTITNDGLAKLAGFPFAGKLGELFIASNALTDAAFPAAARFPKLHHLSLSSKQITGSGIAHLKASSISMLHLEKCELADSEMVHLQAMPNLAQLDIISTTIGDAGLKHISEVKQLGTLQMQNCGNLTDEGMKHLEKCLTLQRLEFGNNSNKMTGATLKSVGKLKNLTFLGLPLPHPDAPLFLTDADIKPLLGCEKLEVIGGINHKNITDLSLETLAQFKNLKELQLKGTKVTAAGVKTFRAARPECMVASNFPE